MTPLLRVRGLAKSYPSQPVLSGLDLDVAEGSLTAILGPSGCGKTTLLRLIAGFDRPDAGSIELAGATVTGQGAFVPPERRRVGYVPQEGALFPHLDVAANVGFGLPRDQRRGRRVDELLELVGMAEYRRRLPHELSGGQQQRVAVARALAPSPALVLLDEPFAGLDPALRGSLRGDVKRALDAFGATTLLVTHDQAEALSLADEVGVLRGGRLVQTAPPRTVYWEPADVDVARFVGDANLLPAVVCGRWVRCALGCLEVRNPGTVPDGPATVLVRPEQILGDAEAGCPARVLDVAFLGHEAHASLALVDGSSGPLLSRMPSYAAPARGALVSVDVREPVTVYPAA
jgi:iron(III) transport system ATP-binding protein